MAYRQILPSFNLGEIADTHSMVTSAVTSSKGAQLLLNLAEMKALTKPLTKKNINDLDEISMANEYAYGLKAKYHTSYDKSLLPGLGKKSVVCPFTIPNNQDSPGFPEIVNSGNPDLEKCALAVGLLGDDINDSNVIFNPNSFRPENVVNFLRKSGEGWESGRIAFSTIRIKNQFIDKDAVMTREIPEDWDIPEDFIEESDD